MDLLHCSQPLYLVHTKGNVSKASVKHTGLGGGGVCEESEQEQIERL